MRMGETRNQMDELTDVMNRLRTSGLGEDHIKRNAAAIEREYDNLFEKYKNYGVMYQNAVSHEADEQYRDEQLGIQEQTLANTLKKDALEMAIKRAAEAREVEDQGWENATRVRDLVNGIAADIGQGAKTDKEWLTYTDTYLGALNLTPEHEAAVRKLLAEKGVGAVWGDSLAQIDTNRRNLAGFGDSVQRLVMKAGDALKKVGVDVLGGRQHDPDRPWYRQFLTEISNMFRSQEVKDYWSSLDDLKNNGLTLVNSVPGMSARGMTKEETLSASAAKVGGRQLSPADNFGILMRLLREYELSNLAAAGAIARKEYDDAMTDTSRNSVLGVEGNRIPLGLASQLLNSPVRREGTDEWIAQIIGTVAQYLDAGPSTAMKWGYGIGMNEYMSPQQKAFIRLPN